MSDKAKRYLAIVTIAAAVVVLALVLVFGRGKKTVDVMEQLDSAKSYYDNLDYDHAVAIYNSILDSDKSCTDAYIGLAEVYLAKDNTDKADEILNRGLENTENDPLIMSMLEEIGGVSAPVSTETAYAESEEPASTTQAPTETTVTPNETTETEETTVETQTAAPVTEPPVTTTVIVTATTTAATTRKPVPITTKKVTEATTKKPVTTKKVTETTTVTETSRTESEITDYVPEELDIKLPNFVGMTKERAFEVADTKGIMIIFVYGYNDDCAKDIVFAQSYPSGFMVSSNMPVEVYVSKGPKPQ